MQHGVPSALVAEAIAHTFHAKILHQNLGQSTFWNFQTGFWFSHCQSPIFVDCSPYTFNILRCSACCRPYRRGSLSTDSQPSLKDLYHTFICTALIATSPKAFLIIWMVSVEEGSSLMQNLMQVHCCLQSVILNVMATQYTCSLNGVCHPHWLVQWSSRYSCMHIPVHSPWLPGFIDVSQNVLIVLIMALIFPGRPHIQSAEKHALTT